MTDSRARTTGTGSLMLLIASALALSACARKFDNFGELSRYDVAWDRPGSGSKDSMPLGNGDISLNVWSENETGSVCFYIGKTDAWDETGRLLKIGKVRVKIEPNPFAEGRPFRQKLSVRDAAVEVTAGDGAAAVSFRVWADANLPVVRVETHAPATCAVTASIEPWRLEPEVMKDALVSGLNYYPEIFGPTVVGPDVVMDEPAARIVWYHRNPETPSFARNLTMQGLEDAGLKDPLKDRIFGALMEGEGFVRKGAKALVSEKGAARALNIHILTRQPATPEDWLAAIEKQALSTNARSSARAWAAHRAHWSAFWDRSWIYVGSGPGDSMKTPIGDENTGFVVTRGYILQRFINACAGRGAFPIKFNGSLFTVDEPGAEGFADYRRWGPGYWWQNTRLPYMSMPACGDFDLMPAFFAMYADVLPLSLYRTRLYFGHGGAFFPECINFWGTVFTGTWGDKNLADMPERIQESGYHKYEWVGGLEMAVMMLDYFSYTRDETFLRDKALPFTAAVLTFFDEHYRVGADGRLDMTPSQALETWWTCTDAMPEVAGLHYLVRISKTLPAASVPEDLKSLLARLEAKLPHIPVREVDGQRMLAPAGRFADKKNVENPELYAVYPFRLYGIGKPDIELAVRALDRREDRGHFGWRQDDIFMALLGLSDQARRGLVERASQWDKRHRFPAFWGPNYDWTPDQDHGAVLMKTLQLMLLQAEDRTIRLLPAWPPDWDADFKLHAPYNTVIEGRIRGGKIVELDVSPRSRRADIVRAKDHYRR
jgi:alpha-L-fucosidase 2